MACLSASVLIEPLEARIAPASLIFTDSDGDTVTITTSKGTDADLATAALFNTADDVPRVLQLLDLSSNSAFKGTDLTIEVTNVVGDGVVNVGYINAAGLDLGSVIIDGDLGQIDAGDAKLSTPAIKDLEIGSLAALGVTTQATGGSIISDVFGSITTLKVNGNVQGTLLVNGGKSAGIDSLEVTGVLLGSDQVSSGSIDVTGAIGTATLGGIQGGSAAESGRLVARTFGDLTIDGNILGGTGEKSGTVRANRSIDSVTVTGDIVGGTDVNAANSGEIRAARSILLATVGGEIRGGEGKNSGSIGAGASLEVVTVGGGLIGGGGFESGTLGSVGRVESVTIGGGITGGTGEKSGGILATARLNEIIVTGNVTGGDGKQSGVIATEGTIANITINGSLVGGIGEESGAIGTLKRIANVTITGDIQGGDGETSGGVLSDGTIGTVTVQGSVLGGAGEKSGAIGAVGVVDSVNIEGNLEGGTGVRSGVVLSGTKLVRVEITGAIIGGSEFESGSVRSDGNIEFASAGSIEGGSDFFASNSGQIFALKNIRTAEVDGDVRSGGGFQSGGIVAVKKISNATVGGNLYGGGFYDESGFQGGVIAANRLGNVVVEGSVIGGSSTQSGSILAFGTFVSGGSSSEEGSFKPNGVIDNVVVKGNVEGGSGSYSGSIVSEGKINSISIGTELSEVPRGTEFGFGSLRGGFGSEFGGGGRIDAHGNINSIKIFGNLEGGSGSGTGIISSGGNIKSIDIGGSIDAFGGGQAFEQLAAGANEFEALAGPRGSISSGEGKAQILVHGRLSKLSVGGSIRGAFDANSAQVVAGSIGSVEVAFDVIAGPGDRSASIISHKDIDSVKIGGELSTQFGGGFAGASISAGRNIGEVTIGNVLGNPDSKVLITAGGTLNAKTNKQALAIGSVTIEQSFQYGQILAGYEIAEIFDPEFDSFYDVIGINPDVQIGKVVVGTASNEPSTVWISSDIVAGAESSDGSFGNEDDRLIGGSSGTSVISKIASVIINGGIIGGSSQGFSSSNGIVAEHVVSVKVLGDSVDLDNGPRNDFFVPVTSDPMSNLVVTEVSRSSRPVTA